MKTAAAIVWCVFALTAAVAQQARDVPARNTAAAGGGTVAGVVRDGGGEPVRRAIVVLAGGDEGGRFTFVTDDDGTFVFSNLKASSYRLSATKPAYVKADYGAKRPGRPGTSIALVNDQQLTGIALTLRRGGVITGRILDETGEPANGTGVRLLQSVFSPSGRSLMPAAGVSTVSADDRGVYRFFGLAPGDYFVAANPVGLPARAIRLTTTGDVASAERAIAAGTRAGGPGPAASAPAPPPAMGSYAPVLYPGVATATSAVPVTVGAGEERSGVDFRIALVPTARVEGTVTSGSPLTESIQVLLLQPPTGMPGAAAVTRTTSAAAPDGHFSFSGVPPGDYVLVASVNGTSWAMSGNGSSSTVVAGPATRGATAGPAGGGGVGGSGRAAAARAAVSWAMAPITVAGRDVTNVVLGLQPALTVSGRLAFDGEAARKAGEWTVILDPAADVTQVTSARLSTLVSADGRFEVTGVTPGRYTVSAIAFPASGAPAVQPWALSSVVAAGRDVTENGVDVGTAAGDLVVTLTDRVAELTGVFQNTSGQPTADYTIILFPADRALWRWESRRILTTRPATDGRYAFRGMPPGAYRLGAVTDVDENEWFDPAFLEPLAAASIPVTIGDGQRAVQDIRAGQ